MLEDPCNAGFAHDATPMRYLSLIYTLVPGEAKPLLGSSEGSTGKKGHHWYSIKDVPFSETPHSSPPGDAA
jgi:hypothetical protein